MSPALHALAIEGLPEIGEGAALGALIAAAAPLATAI